MPTSSVSSLAAIDVVFPNLSPDSNRLKIVYYQPQQSTHHHQQQAVQPLIVPALMSAVIVVASHVGLQTEPSSIE